MTNAIGRAVRTGPHIIALTIAMSPASAAAQDQLLEIQRRLAQGIATVTADGVGGSGQIATTGGLTLTGLVASMEIEFRKAGLRVVPNTERDDSGALLLVKIVCLSDLPVCSTEASLSRFSYFGPGRTRIPGEVWTSGPVAFRDSTWPSIGSRIREWAAEQALITANLILAARRGSKDHD